MNVGKILLATAAAALFIARPAPVAADKTESKVRCEGVNACKGQSACKSTSNACAGKNACIAKGFLVVTEGECRELKVEAEKSKGFRRPPDPNFEGC